MIRCFTHGQMSTMVCQFKGCQHRTLCAECIVTHPKNHLASILPLRDFDPTSYTVPKTIAKDLSLIRQRMTMLQNHLIQTREIRKAEVRRLEKAMVTFFTDEMENFMKTVIFKIEQFYNEKHIKVEEVIRTSETHLNHINDIIKGDIEDSRKFDFLIDLQDKLLHTIIPTLSSQAEEYSRLSMCQDVVVTQHFDKVIQVGLEKAFNIDNVLVTEKRPVTLENDLYDSLTLFQGQTQPLNQKGLDFYKKQLKPYLHTEIVYKDYKVPHSTDFNQKKAEVQVKPNAIPFEVFISQQKHLNTILQGHYDIVTSMAMLSLSQLASGCGDGSIKFWDIDSQICLGTIEAHKGGVWCLYRINGDQPDIASQLISGGQDRLIHIWNVKFMTLDFTLIGHLDFVKSVIYSPKYQWILSGSGDYKIKVWERDKCCYTIEDAHNNIIRCLCVLDEVFASSGDSTIKVWSIFKGQLKLEMSHGADVNTIIDIGKFQIASGGADKMIVIWDYRGGYKLQKLQAHHESVTCLAFLNDQLYSVSNDKTLRVWDVKEGKLLKSLKAHQEIISCVAINSFRDLIFTGSWDKRIRIISVDYIMMKR